MNDDAHHKQREAEQIEESSMLQAKTVYEVIRQEGHEELSRPVASLWWSGVAAGITISTSLWAEGMLRHALAPGHWQELIATAGYSIGFVIVILGRLQLFTENTITPVLPLFADYSNRTLRRTARLWAVVLAANLFGTFLAAAFTEWVRFTSDAQLAVFYEVSTHLIHGRDARDMLVQAIPAGFFVAALVWMLPSSKGFELWVILLMTYLIAIGGFPHVIVGSTEVFLLLLSGQIDPVHAIGSAMAPMLVGNIIGGTVLFSMLAYAQVRAEIS